MSRAQIRKAAFVDPYSDESLMKCANAMASAGRSVGDISAAADYLAPGAIEVNRYATEIVDMVRRRYVLGQRINQTLATGQPHRYFEQMAIPGAASANPRALTTTASQPQRQERVVALKAITAQINYGLFDVEINQQQGQFAYLEAKDLTDTVDGVLKLHDYNLWNGADTDLFLQTSNDYYGLSGQIYAGSTSAQGLNSGGGPIVVPATGSLVDYTKTTVAQMANRQDFEVRPTAIYGNPTLLDLFDKEVYDNGRQLFYNQVEVLPGVVVNGIPTQVGVLPLVSDPAVINIATGGKTQYGFFIMSDVDMIKYAYLTDPLPRVFQLGLLGNLSSQYVVVKFGAVYAEGPGYAHCPLYTVR